MPAADEKKPVKKQQITTMPCMSAGKKEREKAAKNESAKKPIFKANTEKKKPRSNEVGTQILYKGDGRNLSLMELDILQNTGCKWSRIIYPGFRGHKSAYQGNFLSAEKFKLDCEGRGASYSPGKVMTFQNNFAPERNSSMQLRGHNSTVNSQAPKQAPFENEALIAAQNPLLKAPEEEGRNCLMRKIMETSFDAPRSLMGSASKNYQTVNQGSNKKVSSFEVKKFDLGELETVQERVTLPLTDGSLKKKQPMLNSTAQALVKKVINGNIV